MSDIDNKKVELFFSNAVAKHQDENAVLDVADGQQHANIYRNYFTLHYILKIISADKHKTILDFGCGVGRISKQMASMSAEVIGADTNQQMINVAVKNSGDEKNLSYYQLTAFNIPLADKYFDCTFSHWVFQHINDSESVLWLKEIKRTLKSDGRIVLFEQVKNESLQSEKHFFRSVSHYEKLIAEAGLKLHSAFPVMRVPSRGMWLWNKFPEIKFLLPFCYLIDQVTLNRKPEIADYFTYCFELGT